MECKIRKILTALDMYGYPVTLNFQSSTQYKSQTGGLFSLATIGIMIIFTIRGALTLLGIFTPLWEIQEQTLMSTNPNEESIGFNDFTFFIQATLDQQFQLDKPLLNISLIQESHVDQTKAFKNIELQKCNKSHFQDLLSLNYSDQFHPIRNENYLCPDNRETFQLQGIQQSVQYRNLRIIINDCLNTTQCYSKKQIQELQPNKNILIQLGFTNSFINVKESKLEPFVYYTDFLIDSDHTFTRVDLTLSKTYFFDDLSIFPFQEIFETMGFYNLDQDIKIQKVQTYHRQMRSNNPEKISDVYLSLSQSQKYIYKTYARFDSYLAYIGGILQSIVFVMACVVGYYNMLSFYVSLANYLYTFDLKIHNHTEDIDNLQQRIKQRVNKIKRAVQKIIKSANTHLKVPSLRTPSLRDGYTQQKFQSLNSPEKPQTVQNLIASKIIEDGIYEDPLNTISPEYKVEQFCDNGTEEGIQAVKVSKLRLRASKDLYSDYITPSARASSQQDGATTRGKQKFTYSTTARQENDFELDDCNHKADKGFHIKRDGTLQFDRRSSQRQIEGINLQNRREGSSSIVNLSDVEKQKSVLSRFGFSQRQKVDQRLEQSFDIWRPEIDARMKKGNLKIDPERVKQEFHSRREFLQCSIEDVMKYSRRIKMGIFNFVSWICCRQYLLHVNEKVNLIDRAVRMIKKDTDITSILYKLHDIDKLKKLLLSKDQNMLFNYTPKPVIKVRKTFQKLVSVTDQEINSNQMRQQTLKEIEDDIKFIQKKQSNKISLLHRHRKFESMKSFFKLYQAFDRLHQLNLNGISSNDLRINTKLMHLIGEDLRNVFEASYLIDEKVYEGNQENRQSVCENRSNVSNVDEESAEL